MDSTAIRLGEAAEHPRESISAAFMRYFSVSCAMSAAERNAVFRIRYNVYCEEFGFEDPSLSPERLERDAYDDSSIHALVTHRATGKPAGCVRLVLPRQDIESGLLPLEEHCGSSLDHGFIDSLRLDRGRVCEISRLAVDGAFRRRPGEDITRYGSIEGLDCSQQERRSFSLLAVACFLSATALTEITQRTAVFAMMEPFLPRLLKRSGILFHRAGHDVDYHGLRAPYFIRTESALNLMRQDLKELYDEIRKVIGSSYSQIAGDS